MGWHIVCNRNTQRVAMHDGNVVSSLDQLIYTVIRVPTPIQSMRSAQMNLQVGLVFGRINLLYPTCDLLDVDDLCHTDNVTAYINGVTLLLENT